MFATITNTGSHALVGYCNELVRAADFGLDPPEPFFGDCAEDLGHEGGVEIMELVHALFLNH